MSPRYGHSHSPTPSDNSISLTDLAGIMLLPRATSKTDHGPSAPSFWVIFVPVILGCLLILGIAGTYWYFRKRHREAAAGVSNLPPPPVNTYPPPPENARRNSWGQSDAGTFGAGRWGIDTPARVDPFPMPAAPPAAFRPGAPASVSGSQGSQPSQGSRRSQNSHPSNPSHHSQSPPRSASSNYSPTTPTAAAAFRVGPLSPEPTGNAPAYRTTTPTAASVLADDEVEQSIFDQQRRSIMSSAAGNDRGGPGYTPSMMYNPSATSGGTRPSSPGSPRHAFRTFPDPYGVSRASSPGITARDLPRGLHIANLHEDDEEEKESPTLAQRAHEFV